MIGKMGHGKTGGVPGEKGVPGDKGVPGEDGDVEKAAQLLCSGEMLLWSSAEEEGLRFETTKPYTLHPPQGQPRGWGEQVQTQPTIGWAWEGRHVCWLFLREKGALSHSVESQVTAGKLQTCGS